MSRCLGYALEIGTTQQHEDRDSVPRLMEAHHSKPALLANAGGLRVRVQGSRGLLSASQLLELSLLEGHVLIGTDRPGSSAVAGAAEYATAVSAAHVVSHVDPVHDVAAAAGQHYGVLATR